MSAPLVSIVTPSLNQGAFIRAAVESVLAQRYPHVEYIVMDGGSTDATPAIVSEYASRLTWRSEKDRGQAHAVNKGFALARGSIVAWLNSDDVLLPTAAAAAVDAFAEVPGVGAIYGDGTRIDRDGRSIGRFRGTGPFNLWKLVHVTDYVLQPSTFFRRDAVSDVGWLDETLHYALDWDLLIRIGRRFGLHYVQEPLALSREYEETKTASGGDARFREICRVLERHANVPRPPGFWIHSLDAVHRRMRRRAEAGTPPLVRPAARMIAAASYYPLQGAIAAVERHAQGLLPGGWAAGVLKWMLPEGQGEVLMRGTMPHPAEKQMEIVMGGRVRESWSVAPGAFERRFHVPEHRGPLSFEVHTRPRRTPAVWPSARRAFRLHSIAWA